MTFGSRTLLSCAFAAVVVGCAREAEGTCRNGADDDRDGLTDCDDPGCKLTEECARCGNGVVDVDEACDGEPECDARCLLPGCGDGTTQGSESCDDGNLTTGDGCDLACQFECGNDRLDGAEECDDGNRLSDDGCDRLCRLEPPPVCGDGDVRPIAGEQCDDGNLVNGDGCSAGCVREECGDLIVQLGLGEQCDDGNDNSLDGCDACIVERCGDGREQPGEDCDDGNNTSGDGCTAGCVEERCGDGVVQPGGPRYEDCDDQNFDALDGCNACHFPRCGNSATELGEGCDDGDEYSGDGCSDVCQLEVCGDGVLQLWQGEICDGTSGCDSACFVPTVCDGDVCFAPHVGELFGLATPLFIADLLPTAGLETVDTGSGVLTIVSDLAGSFIRDGVMADFDGTLLAVADANGDEAADIVVATSGARVRVLVAPDFTVTTTLPAAQVPIDAFVYDGGVGAVANGSIAIDVLGTAWQTLSADFPIERLNAGASCDGQTLLFFDESTRLEADAQLTSLAPLRTSTVAPLVWQGAPRIAMVAQNLTAPTVVTFGVYGCDGGMPLQQTFDTYSAGGYIGRYIDGLAVADFDDDGIDDLAISREFASGSLLLSSSGHAAHDMPFHGSLVAADVDADGDPDLVGFDTFERHELVVWLRE